VSSWRERFLRPRARLAASQGTRTSPRVKKPWGEIVLMRSPHVTTHLAGTALANWWLAIPGRRHGDSDSNKLSFRGRSTATPVAVAPCRGGQASRAKRRPAGGTSGGPISAGGEHRRSGDNPAARDRAGCPGADQWHRHARRPRRCRKKSFSAGTFLPRRRNKFFAGKERGSRARLSVGVLTRNATPAPVLARDRRLEWGACRRRSIGQG